MTSGSAALAASRTCARVRDARNRGLTLVRLASLAILALILGLATGSTSSFAYLRAYPPEKQAAPNDAAPANPGGSERVSRALPAADFLDPRNPDVSSLQPYEQGIADLPVDGNGFPDWMRALREGRIKPRAGLDDRQVMTPLDLDIVMKNTKEMPWVRFPHLAHTEWLDCSNCHPQPFEARAGAARIQMADIFRGHYCGMCHDKVAFITFFSCNRCHSVNQPGQTP